MAVKRLLFSILAFCAFFSASAQFDPYWQWAKADTNASLNYAGGTSVLGVRNNRILWGRITSGQTVVNSQVMGGWTFTEYDTLGNQTASATFGGKVEMIDAQADASGNWYILGRFYDSLVLPGVTLLRPNPVSNPDADHFMIRLRAGSFFMDWYKILGATKAVSSRAFTVDNNRIIIALDSTDRTNVCSMNLSSGAYATLFRQGGKSTTSSIQTDASGNIYMAGSCAVKGTLDFNGVSVPLSGMSAAYVAKYLYNYTHAWHHVMNDPTCMPRKVSVFKNKFIYYTGTLTDSLTLGGLSVHPPLLGLDFIAARLDTNGNVIWLRQLDTVASGEASLGTAAFHATVTPDTALVVFAQGHNFVNWGYNISTNLYGTYSSVVVSMGPGSDTRWARTAFADNVTDDRIAGEGNAVWVSGNAYTSTAATAFDTLNLKMPARRWVPYMAKLRLTRPPFVANGVGNVRGTEFAALPNPAHDAIRITGLSSHSVITLRDMNGRTVLEQTVAQGQAVLNVGELPRGLYFLQMRSGGISQVQKILLQ